MGYSTIQKELLDVFKDLESNNTVLPNFQREFEWGKSDQQALLASFFVKLPIGSFLFLEGPKDEYPSKYIGKKNSLIDNSKIKNSQVEFLLDGQQRITTLKSIFTDLYYDVQSKKEFNNLYDDIFNKLNRRWFIDINSDEFKDFSGIECLKFYKNKYKSNEPQDIEEMFVYKNINKSKDDDIWYNPKFKIKNNMTEKEIEKEIVKSSAKEGLIPLYHLAEAYDKSKHGEKFNKKDNITFKIIQKIAQIHYDKVNEIDVFQWASDFFEYLIEILSTNLHIIKVPQDEKGRAIPIFENINNSGTQLDTYDLIIAKAANRRYKDYKIYNNKRESLREAISRKIATEITDVGYNNFKTSDMMNLPEIWRPSQIFCDSRGDLYNEFKTRYLSILSLVSNLDELSNIEDIHSDYIKKSKALDLKHNDINENTYKVLESLIKGGQFLQFRCGLNTINDLSYKLMLVPISYVFLNNNKINFQEKEVVNLLEVWYWFSIFSGTYRDNKNKRCITDIKMLYKVLIEGKVEYFNSFINEFKDRFFNFEDYSSMDALINHKDLPSAIKKSLHQYLLSKCPKDFLNSNVRLNSWNDELNIHSHHIIPLGSDLKAKLKNSHEKLRNSDHILNSPLNKTPILGETNNKILNIAINNYIEEITGLVKSTHYIPDSSINDYKNGLINDEFYFKFLEERYNKIKNEMNNEFMNLLSNLNINFN